MNRREFLALAAAAPIVGPKLAETLAAAEPKTAEEAAAPSPTEEPAAPSEPSEKAEDAQ